MDKKPKQQPKPGIGVKDQVFFVHEGEPHSGTVLAHGAHGCTVDHGGAQRKVYWSDIIGHKERAQQGYTVLERGEAGMIVQDEQGKRRFVQGGEDHPAFDDRPREPGVDDIEQVRKDVEKTVRDKPLAKALGAAVMFRAASPTAADLLAELETMIR